MKVLSGVYMNNEITKKLYTMIMVIIAIRPWILVNETVFKSVPLSLSDKVSLKLLTIGRFSFFSLDMLF